jgi:hypothetical protein
MGSLSHPHQAKLSTLRSRTNKRAALDPGHVAVLEKPEWPRSGRGPRSPTLGSKRETFVVTMYFALPLDLEDYFAPPALTLKVR